MKALVSFCSLSSATLKPLKKGSGKLFRSLGVPQGLVLGPSQNQLPPWSHVLSPRSGRTDRQSDCPFEGPGTASQHRSLLRFVLVGKEPRDAYRALCTVYLTVFWSVCVTPSFPGHFFFFPLHLRQGEGVF